MKTFTSPDWLPVLPDDLGQIVASAWSSDTPSLPDMSWLDELRVEHAGLIDAWQSAGAALEAARRRFSREDASYAAALRDAVAMGDDPESLAPPTAEPIRRARLEVLRDGETAARVALGRFAQRVIDEELPARADALWLLAKLDTGRYDARAIAVAAAVMPLARLAAVSVCADAENARAEVGDWMGGARAPVAA